MKTKILSLFVIVAIVFSSLLVGCAITPPSKLDMSVPNLSNDDWRLIFNDEFTATAEFPDGDNSLNPDIWTTSPHGLRKTEYWCDQMVEVKNGTAIVHSEKRTNHQCDKCLDKNGNPVSNGIFTSGIETRKFIEKYDGSKEEVQLFSQAFGFFETRVRLPRGSAMWSAFWLQSVSMNKIGNKGLDGSEIDIYESSFLADPTKIGNCIHYDGYNAHHRSHGMTTETNINQYDGEFHTYALKWTPTEYVFYLDGNAIWATDAGGISRVPEFLRLTVEIREDTIMPYGQKSGKFVNNSEAINDFVIDYVKVYQNETFEAYIMRDDDYQDKTALLNGILIGGSVIGGIVVLFATSLTVILIVKKRKLNKSTTYNIEN